MPAAYAEEDVAYREYFQPCDPSSVPIELGIVTLNALHHFGNNLAWDLTSKHMGQ